MDQYKQTIKVLSQIHILIVEEMLRRSLTWRDAAYEIGVSASYLYDVANENKKPTVTKVILFLKWLDRSSSGLPRGR